MERKAGRAVDVDYANPGDLQRRANLGRDPQYQLRSGRDRLRTACPVLRNRRLFLGGVLPGTAKAGVCAASLCPLCAGKGSGWPRHGANDRNYVYHNILGRDRQEILLETLRVLKKGGTFALHDIFSKAKYGDMQAFVQRLRTMGYQQVELIDTTNGMFMSPWEAKWMALSGSALLVGKK